METLTNHTSIVELHQLLEILQKTDMRIRDTPWQLVPILNRQLNIIITDSRKLLDVVLLGVELQQRDESLEELDI